MKAEIIAVDNEIQAVINKLEAAECKIAGGCKKEVLMYLRCAIAALDEELEELPKDASS